MVMVRLTPAGRQMLEEIETLREQFLRRVLDRLDPTQLTGVAKAMADLRDAVAATATGADAHHHTNESQGRN
jgi:DNA-binding MarR family transcriptional regulator